MQFKQYLARAVDGSSLAVMRIAVGLVMVLEAYTLCHPSASTFGQVPLQVFYTGPNIHVSFPYQAFGWLPLLPPHWIYAVVGIMALAGFLMALGFVYRAAAAVVFLSWGYLYAVESTRTYWMSYYYLELLITFLMIWMPAERNYSVDSWLAKVRGRPLPETVPFWTIFLLRWQLVVTYFYGGVAKLNADWLINAEPVRYFLSKARILNTLGPHLSPSALQHLRASLQNDSLAYFISYAGVAFDLSVGFLLLARRTRIFGIVLMIVFHTTNHFVLFEDLEWFPLVGLLTALIFLDPDWPERFWKWLHRPRIAKPDLAWLGLGAVVIPLVGAALGWSPAPTPGAARKGSLVLGPLVQPFVIIWLACQAILPLRHYLIPGDSRFTWEGLSFSWRLKAELYRSQPCTITVNDPKILSKDEKGITRVNWNMWKQDPVVYRTVPVAKSEWHRLPEVMIILEAEAGERVIYNPFSGIDGCRSEPEARARIDGFWQAAYGRKPQAVLRTFSVGEVLSSYAKGLAAKGETITNAAELFKKHGKQGDRQLLPALRRTAPFGVQAPPGTPLPFLVIDDENLYHPGLTNITLVDRHAWVESQGTLLPGGTDPAQPNQPPMVVYSTDIHVETTDFLPETFLFDALEHPQQPVSIAWNYLKELSVSEAMHVSMQPFFLRRYAQHIANQWEKEHGDRPEVRVETEVSLNGRPFQRLVDPEADLASVPVKWFGHNYWIHDLETPRIEADGLVPQTRSN
jgi:vitamin K-dependent gamma-carboxylase